MPPHAITEYAGHRSFIETERYLKYMPQQIALGANISSSLAEITNATEKLLTHSLGMLRTLEC